MILFLLELLRSLLRCFLFSLVYTTNNCSIAWYPLNLTATLFLCRVVPFLLQIIIALQCCSYSNVHHEQHTMLKHHWWRTWGGSSFWLSLLSVHNRDSLGNSLGKVWGTSTFMWEMTNWKVTQECRPTLTNIIYIQQIIDHKLEQEFMQV